MALRGKKPVLKPTRFKTVLFGESGSGKTHFCCGFPSVYYIDTEGSTELKTYHELLSNNEGSASVILHCLQEVVDEIRELSQNPSGFKTVVIDSISPLYEMMATMEAKRLKASSKDASSDGKEFQRHLAKPKSLVYELGILLSKIDMNVIVTAHHKVKWKGGEVIGDTYECYNKIGYMLNGEIEIKPMGPVRRGFAHKSRHTEFPEKKWVDFTTESVMELFGKEIFTNESKPIDFVTAEQLSKLNRLLELMSLDDEYINSILGKFKVLDIKDLEREQAQQWIEALVKQVEGDGE